MRYLIYELWNPLKNEPFYVGWTDTKQKGLKRPMEHIAEERRIVGKIKTGNRLKLNIIRKIRLAGSNVDVKEIYYSDNFEHSLKMESKFIKHWGRRNKGLGPLANLTDGGQGMIGVIDSIETRKKKSLGRQGKVMSEYSKDLIREKRKLQKPNVMSQQFKDKQSKNTWFRNNTGKTLEEIYGIEKATNIKKAKSIAQTRIRNNPIFEEKRKIAHRRAWLIKMKNIYLQIFNLLDEGYKQFEIVKKLQISTDTVRKARLQRSELEAELHAL